MQIVQLGAKGAERPGVIVDGQTYELSGLTERIDGAFLAQDGIARIKSALAAGELPSWADAESLRIGAPIAQPTKIVCVGLNYKDHAAETGAAIPEEPVVFMKDPSTIVGPNDEVFIPRNSQKTDWEVELGIVIAKDARYLESPEEAPDYIAGFVLSHDVSEREFQLERGGQWDKGKSCENFNPLGPYLVPASEIPNPQDLELKLWVNGQLRQNGTTANMIFSVNHIVWYLSQFMVLRAGDLINTGTPAGVAMGFPDQPYLRAGDVTELEITRLGRSRQTFIAA